jgi:hypothetical protein
MDWTKDSPTSLTFTAKDSNGNVIATATLVKEGSASRLTVASGGASNSLAIAGDFAYAKELLSGIGNAI